MKKAEKVQQEVREALIRNANKATPDSMIGENELLRESHLLFKHYCITINTDSSLLTTSIKDEIFSLVEVNMKVNSIETKQLT